MIILMCDGSSYGNPGVCKIGVVIWKRIAQTSSSRKTSPHTRISKTIGQGTVNDAEWQAVLEGVKWAKDHTITGEEVFLYTDSRLVVNQINGVFKIKSPNAKGYKALYNMITSGLNITVSWLPRQLTCMADKLT